MEEKLGFFLLWVSTRELIEDRVVVMDQEKNERGQDSYGHYEKLNTVQTLRKIRSYGRN